MTTKEIVQQLKERLKPEGIEFFRKIKAKYGTVNAVWTEGQEDEIYTDGLERLQRIIEKARGNIGIPHSVHFREGMAVRNMLREITNYSWTAHEYDNHWAELTEKAIENENVT